MTACSNGIDPCTNTCPSSRCHDPVASERVTVRDLLAHRSGLPRHEFVWLGHPERTRADLVRRLRYLPLSADIRQRWQYTNLGYVAVGHLIDSVGGATWEDFVTTRLLKALGMDRSNVSLADSERLDDVALPHERRAQKVVRIPFRDLGQIGPAGSINSCLDDMLAYVRAQLSPSSEGPFSPAAVAELHGPQVILPEDQTFPESTRFAYGLGWVVGRYRGHRIVEHNGGVDGFLTDCMMLPDDGIGVVVLTNCWSSIGSAIAYRAFDELLGLDPIDWTSRFSERTEAAHAARDQARADERTAARDNGSRQLEAYSGRYEHPGYGSISVEIVDGALVPRFGTLALSLAHQRDDVFELVLLELADQDIRFPLTFITGPGGDIAALTIPFEDEIDSIWFERMSQAGA
jgi:CubicO group peptidase (beta-lactamase class C family)